MLVREQAYFDASIDSEASSLPAWPPPIERRCKCASQAGGQQFNVVHSRSKRGARTRPTLDGWRFRMEPLRRVTPSAGAAMASSVVDSRHGIGSSAVSGKRREAAAACGSHGNSALRWSGPSCQLSARQLHASLPCKVPRPMLHRRGSKDSGTVPITSTRRDSPPYRRRNQQSNPSRRLTAAAPQHRALRQSERRRVPFQRPQQASWPALVSRFPAGHP